MKRIFISAALILAAGGIAAAGSTGAFFSDSETSSGNTFTAGAIDLKIDNTSYYNGVLNLGTTWTLDELNNGSTTLHKFFDFSDIKPGDIGEDTISLHVNTNDAYLCANVKLTSNDDNTPNEPELLDDTTTGVGLGELAQAVNFLWWADDGDNVLEAGENVISQGPISAIGPVGSSVNVPLADSSTNIWTPLTPGPLAGNTTKYIGKGWCFGTIGLTPVAQDGFGPVGTPGQQGSNGPDFRTAGFTCNGSLLNNSTQTDSLTADVSFEATQSRNNPNFTCATRTCPIVTTNILLPGAGFETPEVTSGEQWDIFPSGSGGWNVEWRSDVPTTFNSQNRPEVPSLELHEGVLGPSADGDQYIELDSDWNGHVGSLDGEPASTKIYQMINTVPGQSYEIHYAFAARPNTPANDNNVEVRWGGNVVDTAGPTAGTSSISWLERTVMVVATTTSTRFELGDIGTANSLGSFIDNIRVFTQSCVLN
jgi:predicted ribosomally synthesized peptide with SipW-like signal peptide